MSFTVKLIVLIATYVVALGVLGIGFKWLYSKIKDNTTLTEKVNIIKDLIEKVVVTTNQTFVSALKDAGTFDEAAQKEAFEKTKSTILSMINDNYKTLITDLFGDFDVFIKSNIEYYVNKNKENLLSFSSCLGTLESTDTE